MRIPCWLVRGAVFFAAVIVPASIANGSEITPAMRADRWWIFVIPFVIGFGDIAFLLRYAKIDAFLSIFISMFVTPFCCIASFMIAMNFGGQFLEANGDVVLLKLITKVTIGMTLFVFFTYAIARAASIIVVLIAKRANVVRSSHMIIFLFAGPLLFGVTGLLIYCNVPVRNSLVSEYRLTNNVFDVDLPSNVCIYHVASDGVYSTDFRECRLVIGKKMSTFDKLEFRVNQVNKFDLVIPAATGMNISCVVDDVCNQIIATPTLVQGWDVRADYDGRVVWQNHPHFLSICRVESGKVIGVEATVDLPIASSLLVNRTDALCSNFAAISESVFVCTMGRHILIVNVRSKKILVICSAWSPRVVVGDQGIQPSIYETLITHVSATNLVGEQKTVK